MARLSVNQMDVYYEEQGRGDEVFVFAQHSGESTNELLSLLPSDYHIYIVDLPGYGRSTNLSTFRGFKQWSDDIFTFSRKLSIKEFTFLGYSMTGHVGFQLALDHPEAVKALVAIVSIPISKVPLPGPEEQKVLDSGTIEEYHALTQKGFLFPVPTGDKKRLQRREQALKRTWQKNEATDREALSFMQEQIFLTKEAREKFVPHLDEINLPTLLLLGSHDWSNPVDQSIVSAMSIPNAKAVFFQGYGHGLRLESPEKLADEIIIFINDLNKNRQKGSTFNQGKIHACG